MSWPLFLAACVPHDELPGFSFLLSLAFACRHLPHRLYPVLTSSLPPMFLLQARHVAQGHSQAGPQNPSDVRI